MAKAKFEYISNPFTVYINSFKALSLNLNTLLGLIGVGLGSVAVVVLVVATGGLALGDGNQLAPWLLVVAMIPLAYWLAVLCVAYIKYALATAQGKAVSLSEALNVGLGKALGFIGLVIVCVLMIVGGLLLLIIPGLIFMYWLVFAQYVYVDQDVGIGEAIGRSRRLVRGKLAELGGMVGVSLIFSLPSSIPVFGSLYNLVYAPVSQIAWSYRYQSARYLDKKGQAKPPTHPANYWVIGLALALPLMIVTAAVIGAIVVSLAN